MPDRDDTARIRILEAYERAKRVDPSLTQGAFMRAGAPGSRVEGLAGKFKSDDTASRYFRKIRSGERTGGAMYRQGSEHGPGRMVGLFQLRAKFGDGKFISQNISVANAESTFDIAAIEYEIRHNRRERIEAMIAHYRERYAQEEADLDMDSMEVRTIRHQRRPIRMRLAI